VGEVSFVAVPFVVPWVVVVLVEAERRVCWVGGCWCFVLSVGEGEGWDSRIFWAKE